MFGTCSIRSLELGVDRLDLFVQCADAVAKLAHAPDQRLARCAASLVRPTSFEPWFSSALSDSTSVSSARRRSSSATISSIGASRVRGRDRGFDAVRVFADQSQIEHRRSPSAPGVIRPRAHAERPA